jgi:RNA polymerase-binding transcription factor DksA
MRESGDEVDRANELAEMATANSLYLTRKKARPEQVQNADGSWPIKDCDECGLPIEKGRIKLGKIRCIACQTELERLNALRGKR